jgi:hypothetical protein
MSVVPLTLTLSLLLVLVFVVFFLREHARGNVGGAERDSLLPLGDELPRLARPTATHAPASVESDRIHADGPDHDGCGCRNVLRPPCAGCSKVTTDRSA